MDTNFLQNINDTLATLFGGCDSLFVDGLAMSILPALSWLPFCLALFYIVVKNNETMSQIAIIGTCILLCVLFANVLPDAVVKENFSVRASAAMSVAFFFSLLVRDALFSMALVAWTLMRCWASVYIGECFPTDVFFGLLWGILVGGLSYLLYRKLYFLITPRLNYISTHFTSTGYGYIDIHVILTVFAITCCYIVVKAFTVAM